MSVLGTRGKRVGSLCAALLVFASLSLLTQENAVGVAADGGGVFVPVSPDRVVNATTWTGGTGSFTGGESRNYTVAGNFGVPSTGVSAVVLNLAAYGTTATTSSYLTAWATGQTRPVVSSLYYTHDNVPRSNTVVVPLGTSGRISLYNYTGTTNVVADIQGYFTSTSTGISQGGFVPLDVPMRVANTSTGQNVTAGAIPVGGNRDIQVTGIGGIASTATAVFANVEVSGATVNGALRFGPGATTLTGSMAMSYGIDGRYDSGVSIKLNGSGVMRVNNYTGSPVQIKVDVQGYFSGDPTEGGSYTPMTPTNVYSTTSSGQTDLQGGETRIVNISGVGGLAAAPGMGAAMLTVSVKNWTAGGTVTVYPADIEWPGVSNVGFNYNEGNPANGLSSTAVVGVDIDGNIALYNTSPNPVRVTLTAQGWFSSTFLADSPGPVADPLPPTSTSYDNIDNYELKDVAAIAENEGRTVAAVAAEVGEQDVVEDAVAEIEDANPGTIAYADLGDATTDPTIMFKGSTVPASVPAILDDLPVQVDALTGAAYSAEDMTEVSSIVRDDLVDLYGTDATVSVETSPDGTVAALVNDAIVTPTPPTTTAARTSARTRVAAQAPSVVLPGVDVELSNESVASPTYTDIVGGQFIAAYQDGRWGCTSGFPAKETTGDQNTGIITAAHCHNDVTWNNGNYVGSAEQTLWNNPIVLRKSTDVSTKYRYGDMEYHRARYDIVKPLFFATLIDVRPFTGISKVVVRTYCIFGRKSNGRYAGKAACAKPKYSKVSVHYSAELPGHGAMDIDNLVIMAKNVVRRGDSGGPVFYGTRGVGIVSGWKPCSKGSTKRCTLFSPLKGNFPRAGTFDIKPLTQ